MKILQISDTHNRHQQLTNLPVADVIVHCGDFTDMGTEDEVLDFLNWFIGLPYAHKVLSQAIMIFVYGMQRELKIYQIMSIFFRTKLVKLTELDSLA